MVDIGAGSVPNTLQNVIDLSLDIGHEIDVIYDWHLKGFLIPISYNSKYISEIRVQLPLVEERDSIKNSQVYASLHDSNDVGLQWEKIDVRYYQVVKSLYINNRLAFFSVRSKFPDYKD